MPKTEITYEIVQQIGILKENKSGWQRELNIVKWNNGKPKLDIRDWAPEHERAGKGITLTSEEVAVLKELLDAMNIKRVELEGYEADDLIATYARLATEQNWSVRVISADKDLMQLVDNVDLFIN